MKSWDELGRFLVTDPQDVGSDEAIRLMHVYADLVLHGSDRVGSRYPGIAAHFRAGGPAPKTSRESYSRQKGEPLGERSLRRRTTLPEGADERRSERRPTMAPRVRAVSAKPPFFALSAAFAIVP